jgi:hypothetical protein
LRDQATAETIISLAVLSNKFILHYQWVITTAATFRAGTPDGYGKPTYATRYFAACVSIRVGGHMVSTGQAHLVLLRPRLTVTIGGNIAVVCFRLRSPLD